MKKVVFSLLSVSLMLGLCGCSGTKGFLADDDFSMTDPLVYKKRYTEGFLDMTLVRRGTLFPKYEIVSCEYTKQNLSSIVLERNQYFSDDDTVRVYSRDDEELGTYMIRFTENESSSIGIVMEQGKVKTATAHARLVIPYDVRSKYLKIGSKRIDIPE